MAPSFMSLSVWVHVEPPYIWEWENTIFDYQFINLVPDFLDSGTATSRDWSTYALEIYIYIFRFIKFAYANYLSVRSSVRCTFVQSFVFSFVCSFVRSFMCSFDRPCVRPFARPSVRSCVPSFVRAFVCSFVVRSCMCSFDRSCVRSFVLYIRSFVGSFVRLCVCSFVRTHERTNECAHTQTKERTNKHTNERKNECTNTRTIANERTNERTHERPDGVARSRQILINLAWCVPERADQSLATATPSYISWLLVTLNTCTAASNTCY
jgi:hypothetical protein